MRRKLFSLLLMLFAIVALAGCGKAGKEALVREEIRDALDLIAVPGEVNRGFELPVTQNNVALEWSSDHKAIAVASATEGAEKVNTTVNRETDTISVTLTVVGKLKGQEVSKKFVVKVRGLKFDAERVTLEQVVEVQDALELPSRTHSTLALDVSTPDGVRVVWSSSNEDVISVDGAVTRPAGTGTGVKVTAAVSGIDKNEQEILRIREFFVFVYGTDIDVNGVYTSAYGEVETLNPLMSTSSSDSDVYDLLNAPLYTSDYDWHKAIEDGNAKYPGDFSKVRHRNATESEDDGLIYAVELGQLRVPVMAAKFPYAVNLRNDFQLTYGVVDATKSRENQDNEWLIELRKDLQFADGTKIDASTFEYSFQQYLDGNQNNERANYLYDDDYIPLVNAEDYFKQGRPVDSKDPDGEKYPEVSWDEVGFDIIDKYTFKISLTGRKSQWHVMTYLGIINIVHPENFEKGFNEERTVTNYGTVENIPVSYGPYVLSSWEEDVKFTFARNEKYVQKDKYTIKTMHGPIIKDQKDIINEFKEGNIDSAGVGGEFWNEFMDHPDLYVSPSNSFYRLAISLDRSEGTSKRDAAPILLYPEFRRALYLATDREDYTNEVSAPSEPALGYLSNIHQVSEWAQGSYAKSASHLLQLEMLGLSPATNGYNIDEARALFKEAYAKAVADGKYAEGEKVVMEFSYYDAGSNIKMAQWVKDQYEMVFNKTVKHDGKEVEFEVQLNPMNQAQFTAARNAGDFDMCFTGMSGATFQATFGMGYIFNREASTFLVGRGHDTHNIKVEAEIINLFDILTDRKAAGEELNEEEEAFLKAVDKEGVFKGTFHNLYRLFGSTPNLGVEYEGQEEDLTKITAALEKALLEQMIAIPLFSNTTAAVYAKKVIRMAPSYSLYMGWGGLPYTHIRA